MHQAGLDIAPQPIFLDRNTFTQPVVIYTWLDGQVKATPPEKDTHWQSLINHFAAFHTLTPENTLVQLKPAVINFDSSSAGLQSIHEQIARVPQESHPDSLKVLLERLEYQSFPVWAPPQLTLCRVDPNIQNFIQRPGIWASVDWENSGWGDPAFDVADLMTHPAFLEAPASRWKWLVEQYAKIALDSTISTRIFTYHKILLIWWLAHITRYIFEIPRGLDQRLTPWPEDWHSDMSTKYKRYLVKAEQALLD